ncbi:hypothetical protein BS47DRAFT_1345322 [Hydnum rufescens UP504]|uniref:Uncharacterized protein n=1 Tax=Hydnum rufescens UP504 TaxID=1448309 RepID=A0A9P6AV71_9AGAM|nr:hypothetical protein BS47DRAFT_1345322 [Hydnum rufescens UP504]
MGKYSSLGDVGAVIPASLMSSIDPFVSTVRTLGVMDCPVATLCGLIRSNPATGSGRIHSLVRRRRTAGVRHEFILLRVSIPTMTDMWIRLERSARTRAGSPVASLSQSNFPTNDTCKVSEKDSSLLTDDVSFIAAIVEFGTPPSLDNLERLLRIISEESKIYNVLKENCWFYATIIQDVLAKWCDGILQGTLSHLKFGWEARDRIHARRDEVMNLAGGA